MLRGFWRVIRTVLFAIILAVLFRSYLFASYVVEGKSMEPTLHDGNLLMVNKFLYDIQDINRFDVIVFRANEKEDYVKRVIGLPGDQLSYKNDQLFINGNKVKEAYLEPFKKQVETPLTKDFTLKDATGLTEVPKGKLFVLGDNRRESLDSRYFGFVPIENVVGKVGIRYWPVSELGLTFE
ncbi:signal peptidase I [Aquibacillus sp. 3ASR75-11]|uniref:Signal peptidase I n=1 Tax=Terrihalobacillus insolitus TaxID=2950438 RepID=A0A9X3WY97_9BACI|nr:signal peptidase I [Terrihalobacillus insolitus]MDC3413735.1 signal peptidase I [Terrihalobacillus insolitus]MDC3425594.1 signal peptidase I [Terrihalobacillus insolitus]